jgi:hypothetical protein
VLYDLSHIYENTVKEDLVMQETIREDRTQNFLKLTPPAGGPATACGSRRDIEGSGVSLKV